MPIYDRTIVDFQDKNISPELKDEVYRYWDKWDAGNDLYYLPWNNDDNEFPLMEQYLKDNNVDPSNCLIHYWW